MSNASRLPMRTSWIPMALIVVVLLAGAEARAELYRCPKPGGGSVFTDNPNACPGARQHQPSAVIQKVPAAAPTRAASPAAARSASRARIPDHAAMKQQAEDDMARAWRQKKTQKQQQLRGLEARREKLQEAVTWCNRGGELLQRDSSGLNRKLSCGSVRDDLAGVESEMATIQAYLDEGLEEECRRAGCLPGWIR